MVWKKFLVKDNERIRNYTMQQLRSDMARAVRYDSPKVKLILAGSNEEITTIPQVYCLFVKAKGTRVYVVPVKQ